MPSSSDNMLLTFHKMLEIMCMSPNSYGTSTAAAADLYDLPVSGAHVNGCNYNAHRREGEWYIFTLFLTHKESDISFRHIHTVDGQQYSSFMEAFLVKGLLADDRE